MLVRRPVSDITRDKATKALIVQWAPAPVPQHWVQWERTKGNRTRPAAQLQFGKGDGHAIGGTTSDLYVTISMWYTLSVI
jgi:hypothetical protein